MDPTPPSTTSSQSGHSPDTNFRVVRKRNRVPLSCAPCRHRKLKCNRAAPACDNCVKRGDSTSCSYASPAARKRGSHTHSMSNATPDDMQNRIDRLEGLVLSLMTNGSQSAGPTAAAAAVSGAPESMSSGSLGQNLDGDLDESQMLDGIAEYENGEESDTERVTKSFGIMKVDAESKKTFYIGEAHWAALLQDISEVRNYFSTHKKQYEEQVQKVAQTRKGTKDDSGPALLFGATKPPSREEILSQVPSRYTCDILIARYFNTFDPSTHILHAPTFQKQYNLHWQDYSKTSIVWIGMLFAMMRLAMLSWARDGDEPPEFHGKCTDLATSYRTQMAHCLILADYTKPHNHLIETLIFHLHGEYTCNRDAEASVWVLVGMIARLAMRMGYHRDSKYFPNISPFQGEMRRRIWTFVRQSDLLFSFQIALPSMIRIGDSDTELPRNIYDDEFDEDCASLPPPRPASEATPVSYMIAKAKLAFGFGRVLEEVNGLHRKAYDEILKIDRGLRDIFSSIPEHLRLRPMSEQTLAPISLIMARFGLETVYHKSLCVLHRRFLKAAKTNPRYIHSRRTCLDSAMALLSFQDIQYRETGQRGRMRSLRSYVNSLTTHDFLLAATILCTDLYQNREVGESDADTPSTSISGGSGSRHSGSIELAYGPGTGIEHQREDLLRTLERSRDIWTEQQDQSMEAFKASSVLSMLLEQLRQPHSKTFGSPPPRQYPFPGGNTNGTIDEQNAAMTLGMLSSGVSPNPHSQNLDQHSQRKLGGGPFDSNILFASPTSQEQPYGGIFGAQPNGPFPFNGNSLADFGNQMNLDWEAWDTYMQPPNLGIDPAANLWGPSNSPTNNLFSSISSPSDGPGALNNNSNNDANAALNNSNIYPAVSQDTGSGLASSGSKERASSTDMPPPSQQQTAGQGPQFSADQPRTNSNLGFGGTGGEVFMGLGSPQPGGVPAWKWNNASAFK